MALKDDLRNLAPKNAIIAGLFFVGLYYFLVYNDGSQLVAQKSEIENQMNAKKGKLAKLEQILANKDAVQKEIEELSAQYEKLIIYFPADLDVNRVSSALSTKLEEYGNEVETMNKKALTTRYKNYKESGLKIIAAGNFHSIMKFLAYLTELDKIVDFYSLEIGNPNLTEKSDNLRVHILLSFFSKDLGPPQ